MRHLSVPENATANLAAMQVEEASAERPRSTIVEATSLHAQQLTFHAIDRSVLDELKFCLSGCRITSINQPQAELLMTKIQQRLSNYLLCNMSDTAELQSSWVFKALIDNFSSLSQIVSAVGQVTKVLEAARHDSCLLKPPGIHTYTDSQSNESIKSDCGILLQFDS